MISNLIWQKVKIYLLALLLLHTNLPALCTEVVNEIPLISLKAKNESFKYIIEKIAKVCGYQFFIAEDLGNIPITIQLNNVSLEGSLRRLLRDLNYTIVWDESLKRISISIYGQSVNKWVTIGASPGVRLQSTKDSNFSLSGQKTEFNQATSTTGKSPGPVSQPTTDSKSESSDAKPKTAPDSDLSLSGEKTEFDQASSTIGK
jgi:hypothetical protein